MVCIVLGLKRNTNLCGEKMTAILQTPKSPSFQVMSWRCTGVKPSTGSMVIQLTDTYGQFQIAVILLGISMTKGMIKRRRRFTGTGIPIIYHDRLIFITGKAILGKWHLYMDWPITDILCHNSTTICFCSPHCNCLQGRLEVERWPCRILYSPFKHTCRLFHTIH